MTYPDVIIFAAKSARENVHFWLPSPPRTFDRVRNNRASRGRRNRRKETRQRANRRTCMRDQFLRATLDRGSRPSSPGAIESAVFLGIPRLGIPKKTPGPASPAPVARHICARDIGHPRVDRGFPLFACVHLVLDIDSSAKRVGDRCVNMCIFLAKTRFLIRDKDG